MLSPRRFPDSITRKREAPGDYDNDGEYVAGAVTETTLRASVQPLTLEDVDSVDGSRLVNRCKVYVPLPDALRAAADDANADRVVVDGVAFVVEESMSWRRSHTKAVLLRET